jgi:hypothetical protein
MLTATCKPPAMNAAAAAHFALAGGKLLAGARQKPVAWQRDVCAVAGVGPTKLSDEALTDHTVAYVR